MDAKKCIGIEIGGTKLQIAAGHSDGTILKNISFQVAREDGAAGILRNIESAVKELKNEFSPAAIGTGFGGPIDALSGRIKKSNQIVNAIP